MKILNYRMLTTFVGIVVCTTVVEASPAFSRQMNTNCKTCHYQNIPKLNSFGKEFKLSGFTMTGGIKEIVSEDNGGLQLPSNLNMSFVVKARYIDVGNKAGDPTKAETKLEILDETEFIFGGKISNNIGTNIQFDGNTFSSKFIFSKAYDVGRFGLAFYNSKKFGAFAALESQTTGLYRILRQFENRKKANIFQKLGIGNGAATGVQAYYSGNGLFVTVGQYIPAFDTAIRTENGGYKTLARLTYEFNYSGFDIALGGYYLGGDARGIVATEEDTNSLNRASTGLDFQLQGDVSNMSLMVTAGIILSNTYETTGVIGAADDGDETGFSLGVQFNPIETWGGKIAYLSSADNKDSTGDGDESIIIIGTDYNVNQNVRLALEYSNTSFGDASLTNQTDILLMAHISF